MSVRINGFVASGFEPVQKAFANNFTKHKDIGAACTVIYKNETVVDIWGGYTDKKRTKKWQKDTLIPVFSTTKAAAALCLSLCHSRGLLDYEERVAHYWPAFAQYGKENITVRQLLRHHAGLATLDTKLTPKIIANPTQLDALLAAQKPLWKVDTHQAYHAWTIGWYISALLQRIDPKSRRLQAFFAEEIAEPLGIDFYIGLPQNFDDLRLAELVPLSTLKSLYLMPPHFTLRFINPFCLTYQAMLTTSFARNLLNFNKKDILSLEMGSSGGVSNARNIAQLFYGLLMQKGKLKLSDGTLELLKAYPKLPANGAFDHVLQGDAFRFHLGFMKPTDKYDFSEDKKNIGGFGAGGSFGVADFEQDLVYAYVPNHMGYDMINDRREVALRKAIYSVIDSRNNS